MNRNKKANRTGNGGNEMQPGFVLIGTISVMILLVMVALAMLSLSTIELRASQQGEAMAETLVNARMALIIALGEFLKHAGSDQRVTVPASQWAWNPSSEKVDSLIHQLTKSSYR